MRCEGFKVLLQNYYGRSHSEWKSRKVNFLKIVNCHVNYYLGAQNQFSKKEMHLSPFATFYWPKENKFIELQLRFIHNPKSDVLAQLINSSAHNPDRICVVVTSMNTTNFSRIFNAKIPQRFFRLNLKIYTRVC